MSARTRIFGQLSYAHVRHQDGPRVIISVHKDGILVESRVHALFVEIGQADEQMSLQDIGCATRVRIHLVNHLEDLRDGLLRLEVILEICWFWSHVRGAVEWFDDDGVKDDDGGV